jgi:hypothetical protein
MANETLGNQLAKLLEHKLSKMPMAAKPQPKPQRTDNGLVLTKPVKPTPVTLQQKIDANLKARREAKGKATPSEMAKAQQNMARDLHTTYGKGTSNGNR